MVSPNGLSATGISSSKVAIAVEESHLQKLSLGSVHPGVSYGLRTRMIIVFAVMFAGSESKQLGRGEDNCWEATFRLISIAV